MSVARGNFQTHRIDTGAARLCVCVGGDGPAVALLHGFPQHSLMWRDLAPRISERFPIIVPDQRGMGASSLPDGLVTKTDLADDLAILLDALGHEQACVAGYDLRAGVAVAFAKDYPEHVRKLAVMEFVLAGFGLEQAMAPRPGWNSDCNWHFSVFLALMSLFGCFSSESASSLTGSSAMQVTRGLMRCRKKI